MKKREEGEEKDGHKEREQRSLHYHWLELNYWIGLIQFDLLLRKRILLQEDFAFFFSFTSHSLYLLSCISPCDADIKDEGI